ncbi:MAG: polyprenyl synthetase family protein [Muribaculaceae bacterium]|nr:polyprenyl synthetase family protein [Muribaculaceae bacterium]MBR6489141.1 polyprenyl synthetase family protein [Muribaculaceae bacterium]
MENLNDIRRLIGKELDEMNSIIDNSLKSDNELMNSIVANYLSTKGKQLRPMLVLLSAKIMGDINNHVITAGAAIEILHNASLIHDDVIDESKQRRGKPTINGVWKNHIAVLVGDFFVSRALVCAVETGDSDILKVLANLGANLAIGEMNQIDTARNHAITEEAYYDIINKKTASLFASCVEVGGMAAGVKGERLNAIIEFAQLLGICFQIKDDTFDYFNDPVIGKPTGNDLREGKVTLPLIHALSLEDRPERDIMLEIINQPSYSDSDISCLIEWAKDCGGIEYSYNKMHELCDKACALLDIYGDNEGTRALKAIFHYIIERDK